MAIVAVWAKPGSKKPGVGGRHGDALIVAVAARPIDGRANDAVVATLAEALNVAKREVRIVGGHTGRAKRVEVPDRVAARAAELMGPA
ncbi:MAG: DUF167 domain-containing protein [Candidatus Microthrix parvicella]